VATSSNGGSWVLIDGRPAVEWPGAHGPAGDARHAKPVTLSAGVHRIDYWNVSVAGSVSTLAAWQSPAGGRFEPIPAKAFLPVSEAALVEMDVQGERMTADFFAENAGEAWWPDQYAVRMKFRNLSKSISAQQGGKFEWNFGDGQTSTLAAPTHIYLAPGEYIVTLKASRLADASTFRAKVAVARNWWRQTDPAMEPTKRYADEVALYNLPDLETKCLLVAVSLFEREGMSGPVVAACTEALKRQGVVESQVQKLGLLAGEHLRKTGKADPAVAAYRAIEARLKSTVFKVGTAVQIGETLLHDLHRWDEAEKEYQRVLGTYGTSGADASLRRTHIGLGDIWRHRGDADKARRAYQAAAALKVVSFAPKEAAVRVGTLARYVEEYTREKQWEWAFKFLDDWAWEFPDDKLQGHWSYLKASALVARGDHAAALLEANDVLAAVPANPYAVRLLMLAADCYVTLGDKDKARLLLQTAAEDYPEDPDQSKARQRLTTLGGPLTAEKPRKP
jgi:tetratricopeptide (TPR) repeat protein